MKIDDLKFEDFKYNSLETDTDNGIGDIFKVVFMGNSGVGKSNIMSRFTKDYFNPNSKSTIGVDFSLKNVQLADQLIKLQLWDTAGQERYKTFTTTYFKEAHGVLFVYDITVPESFADIEKWLENANKHLDLFKIGCLLIGNKLDLEEERKVSTSAGKDFAEKHGMIFFEASAKSNVENFIGQAFYQLVKG